MCIEVDVEAADALSGWLPGGGRLRHNWPGGGNGARCSAPSPSC
jgi:hypothetical protein